MKSERRQHERKSMSAPILVRLLAEEETFTPYQYSARCLNLSLGGALIVISEMPYEQYEILFRRSRYVRLRFRLSDERSTQLFGRVVWHEYRRDRQPPFCQMGVMFEPLGKEDMQRLEAFLHGEAEGAGPAETAE